MAIDESGLPTKSVDNSVDSVGVTALSIGFYYEFVKLADFSALNNV